MIRMMAVKYTLYISLSQHSRIVTMTVTFVVAPGYEKTSAPSSFTVVSPAPAGSDSPATVESIALVVLSNILTKSSSCSSRLPARFTPSAAGEWQSNGIFYDS